MSEESIFEEKLIYIEGKTEVILTNKAVTATLTENALTWPDGGEDGGGLQSLLLDDVVGASIIEPEGDKSLPGFVVNAYPLVRPRGWLAGLKKPRRELQEYEFACESVATRSRWIKAINNILSGGRAEEEETLAPRRLQILLNPQSGQKKGRQIFEAVRPLLEKSYLQFTVIETSYRGQAREIVREMDLSEVDGLAIVGGDGTIHEVINGLTSRADWEEAILTPIGTIPAGTSNGLSKTLSEISGEPYDPISATFAIAKGKVRPLDLAIAEQNGRRFSAFLSLAWGLIADVDIESDKMRFLGPIRTDLYALMRIWNLRAYKGRFSFLLTADTPLDPTTDPAANQENKWQAIEDEFILFWAMNVTWATYDIKAAPDAQLSDGAMDVLVVRRGVSKLELLSALLKSAKGEHIFLPSVEYYKVCSFRLEPLTSRGILAVDGEPVDYSPIQLQIYKGMARVFCT
ncbi:MAG: sphingosine kinase [Oscillatoria sp. SIO1A7]|nr:sphingosine kinase [Oscillatoria sp. SIO1A7]